MNIYVTLRLTNCFMCLTYHNCIHSSHIGSLRDIVVEFVLFEVSICCKAAIKNTLIWALNKYILTITFSHKCHANVYNVCCTALVFHLA